MMPRHSNIPPDEIKRLNVASMIWSASSLFLPYGVAATHLTSFLPFSPHSFACSIWTSCM